VTTADKTITLTSEQLAQICTSQRWQHTMQRSAPFSSFEALCDSADKAFCELNEQDWLEAFAGHPMIGDISILEKKYAQGKALSEAEQSGVATATREVLQQLLEMNKAYLEKFGFIFIVCATNKSASEMLSLLTDRLPNSCSTELLNASAEQRKISQIRMEVYR
jgi:2-oxo-4-hydroxy-4-carboxy-5-ureidoimidazoline decarboxylase